MKKVMFCMTMDGLLVLFMIVSFKSRNILERCSVMTAVAMPNLLDVRGKNSHQAFQNIVQLCISFCDVNLSSGYVILK